MRREIGLFHFKSQWVSKINGQLLSPSGYYSNLKQLTFVSYHSYINLITYFTIYVSFKTTLVHFFQCTLLWFEAKPIKTKLSKIVQLLKHHWPETEGQVVASCLSIDNPATFLKTLDHTHLNSIQHESDAAW